MSELDREILEKRLLSMAKGLDYPRTPDIAGSVMRRLQPKKRSRFISRRFAWSLTIIVVLFSSLMLIPPARAAIIEFIQIGIVRIFPRPTQPPVEVIRTATPEQKIPMTATPASNTSTLLPFLDRIAGETTLADAQQRSGYPILLPTYPSDLGKPDRVFVQEEDGVMVFLVWLDPQKPERVLMSLHFIPSGSWVIKKSEPETIQETSVSGHRAVWATGTYPFILSNGDIEFTRLISGNVLIWANGDVTYRLETDLSLEESLKIAESLEPASVP
jgi:hypothetical protein